MQTINYDHHGRVITRKRHKGTRLTMVRAQVLVVACLLVGILAAVGGM